MREYVSFKGRSHFCVFIVFFYYVIYTSSYTILQCAEIVNLLSDTIADPVRDGIDFDGVGASSFLRHETRFQRLSTYLF